MTGKSGPSLARWRADPYPYEQAVALASALGVSHTTASVLVRRGFTDATSAQSFLEGAVQHDPRPVRRHRRARSRLILRHVESRSPIVVHGDYDVDGICSTALFVRALRGWARSRPSFPSRVDDGYGLSGPGPASARRGARAS